MPIYRGYTVSRCGTNWYINKPNGERLCAEVPPTLTIAQKWVDMDLREQATKATKATKGRGK